MHEPAEPPEASDGADPWDGKHPPGADWPALTRTEEKASILLESYRALAREVMELSDLSTTGEPDDDVAGAICNIGRAMEKLALARMVCVDLATIPRGQRLPDEMFDRALAAIEGLPMGVKMSTVGYPDPEEPRPVLYEHELDLQSRGEAIYAHRTGTGEYLFRVSRGTNETPTDLLRMAFNSGLNTGWRHAVGATDAARPEPLARAQAAGLNLLDEALQSDDPNIRSMAKDPLRPGECG